MPERLSRRLARTASSAMAFAPIRVLMEPEIKSACIKAGVRLGVGLSVVTALVGIRLVTATPDGVEAGVAALERLDAELAAESEQAQALESVGGGDVADPPSEDSIVSRLGAGVRDHLPDADSSTRDGDQMVSCRIGGRTHFMRAATCAMRGGSSTLVEHDP